jgi:hypothetical protein
MHRHRLHSELDHYRLPEPPASPVTGNSFIVCPAVLFQGSQGWQPWQVYLYQQALARAQAAARPSLADRDWLGVWN